MTNTRLLKNAKLEYCQVNQNKMHAFSLSHALSIYPIKLTLELYDNERLQIRLSIFKAQLGLFLEYQ